MGQGFYIGGGGSSRGEGFYNALIGFGTLINVIIPPFALLLEVIFSLSHYVFVTEADGVQGGYGFNFRPSTDIPNINTMSNPLTQGQTRIFTGFYFWLLVLGENIKVIYLGFWVIYVYFLNNSAIGAALVVGLLLTGGFGAFEIVKTVFYFVIFFFLDTAKTWFWIGYAPGPESSTPSPQFVIIWVVGIIISISMLGSFILILVTASMKRRVDTERRNIRLRESLPVTSKIESNLKLSKDYLSFKNAFKVMKQKKS